MSTAKRKFSRNVPPRTPTNFYIDKLIVYLINYSLKFNNALNSAIKIIFNPTKGTNKVIIIQCVNENRKESKKIIPVHTMFFFELENNSTQHKND